MLITILIVIIILALALYALNMVPLDAPLGNILRILCVVIAIVFIARAAGLA